MARRSNCSSGVPIDVYWHALREGDEDAHIEVMVEALLTALQGDHRLRNPYADIHNKARFRHTLKKAAQGEAEPVDEVKSVRGGRDTLFELRWNGVDVAEQVDGKPQFKRVGARLIHAEPMELSMSMVGLLAHEKPYTDDGLAIQDQFLDQAEQVYNAGVGNLWGITLRNR